MGCAVRRALFFSLVASAAILAAGCDVLEPRARSPFSGKEVTAAELQAEAVRWDAERQAAEVKSEAEESTALRRARAEALLEARRVSNAADTQLTEIQSRAEAAAQDVAIAAEARRRSDELAIASMQAAADTAVGSLRRQHEQRSAVLGAVLSIPQVQALPGASAIGALLTGLLGTGVGAGAVQLTKRALRSDLARTKQALAETGEAASLIVDSIDVLKEKDDGFAKVMREHKDLLNQWQGEKGARLVERLQRGERLA